MAHMDSMKIEFSLVVDSSSNSESDIINKPIVSGDRVIGIINEAKLDAHGLYCNCKGFIWDDRYVKINKFNDGKFNSIEIGL